MKHVMPYVIEEMKARIDSALGVALDSVYACDVPVLVEYEYDRDEDKPAQVRGMVVKMAQDFSLDSDFGQLVIKQGVNLNDIITVRDESAIEDAIHKRMAAIDADDNEAMQLHAAGI